MDATLLALVEGKSAVVFEEVCRRATRPQLEAIAADLEAWRRTAENFYHRVRAIFFLEALHR